MEPASMESRKIAETNKIREATIQMSEGTIGATNGEVIEDNQWQPNNVAFSNHRHCSHCNAFGHTMQQCPVNPHPQHMIQLPYPQQRSRCAIPALFT